MSVHDQAIASAVLAEREACAKIVDGWVGMFQSVNPKYVTPQQWAVDAMEDVAEAIRARGNTK